MRASAMGAEEAVEIRQAQAADSALVAGILAEAAAWLEHTGRPLWRLEEVAETTINADVRDGLFWIATVGDQPAGAMKFQLEDRIMWPDAVQGDAAYVHRLAVRRRFAGGAVSGALLRWAADRARGMGRAYLRLDCEVSRLSLRRVYERQGFQFHSEWQAGPYRVARYELGLGGQ